MLKVLSSIYRQVNEPYVLNSLIGELDNLGGGASIHETKSERQGAHCTQYSCQGSSSTLGLGSNNLDHASLSKVVQLQAILRIIDARNIKPSITQNSLFGKGKNPCWPQIPRVNTSWTDVALWCYKWTDWWDGSPGGVKYKEPCGANKEQCGANKEPCGASKEPWGANNAIITCWTL